jgi:phospholipase A1
MKLFFLFFITLSPLFSSTEYEDAYTLYTDGNYTESFQLFKDLAEDKKDLEAAYILAFMYENGEGCEIDSNSSTKWYKYSARGYYFREKENTSRDTEKEKLKIYDTLSTSDDKLTNQTIKRYSQSMYNVKAHDTNYFLPVSYRFKGQYEETNGHHANKVETEFQISIKYDFGANMLGFNEIYSIGYTQLAFWQLYEESAYFRETNYNPELFVTIPTIFSNEKIFLKAVCLSFAHESNGRGGAEERSWNYLSASAYFQYKLLFSELKLWKRLPDSTDYNPNLIEYMGHGHLRFILPYREHIAQLVLKSNFKDHGSVELNYSHPTPHSDDLFFYIKAFSGYGESLINYDGYINKIGIGFSISR